MSTTPAGPPPDSLGPGQASDLRERDWLRENWALQCRLAETQRSLKLARADIDAMLNSRSWRSTRLLRTGLDALRRLLHPGSTDGSAPLLRSVDEFAPAIPRSGQPLLMVDVTELAIENLQGGIQHTVKGILSEWLLQPPAGWQIVPVQLTREGIYVSASRDLDYLFGPFEDPWRGCQVAARDGDIFLGLDLLRDHAQVFRDALGRLRSQHVRIDIVIYDLLPIDLAACVPERINRSFEQWLNVVGDMADGAICISETVAKRFSRWFSSRTGRNRGVAISSFRLGVPSVSAVPVDRPSRPDGQSVSFLMVGTVEPRKGYVDAVDAFEQIWRSPGGSDITLTIVGRYGWGMEEFLRRLETHPQLGRPLRWLRYATLDDVHACYQAAVALLFCSYGEGFGLPIVEAAQHRLPMLLRDLPEFREVAGMGAYFFSGVGGAGVEAALRQWLHLRREGKAPAPASDIAISWQQSAGQLLSVVRAVGAP